MDTDLIRMITIIAAGLFDIYISLLFFEGFLIRRDRHRKREYLLLILAALMLTSANTVINNSVIRIPISLIIYSSIAVCYFTGSVFLRLISGIFVVVIGVITEAITALLITWYFQLNITDSLIKLELFITGILISKLVMLIIVKIILNFISKRQYHIRIPYISFMLTIPMVSIFLVLYISSHYMYSYNIDLNALISTIGILYINIIVFVIFEDIIKKSEENKYYKAENEHFMLEKEHYERLLKNQEYIKCIWHDMKNSMITIKACLDNKKYDKAQELIYELSKEMGQSELIATGNIIIDALMNNKLAHASEEGIKIEWDIKIPENFDIDPLDVCIVIGNALDNALEACSRVEEDKERLVQIKILYDKDMLLVSLANSMNPQSIQRINGTFLSTKRQEKSMLHGFGLKNIKRIVQKHGGNMNISMEDETFTLQIALPSAK